MQVAKCPNCGANITVDETKDASVCEFCNTPFVTEKAITQINNTSNNAQTIINNYYSAPPPSQSSTQAPQYSAPPPPQYSAPQYNTQQYSVPQYSSSAQGRPKVNILIAVFLFYLYIIPGVCYIRWVKKKQREWDATHGR